MWYGGAIMRKKKLLMLGLSALLINGAWSQIPRNGSEQKQKAQEEQNRPKIVQPSLPTIQEEKHPSEEKHDSSSQSRNYPWRESLTPASIPDWCLVIVGALAGLIALRSLKVISRQADEMEEQAILVKDQLAEMRRQTDWLIEKERPRLDIELDLFDPRQQTGTAYCITGYVSFYGLTIARDCKAEILVSTERDVVEDAFEYYREGVTIADFHKSPARIEIPRIIRPNSHDIPFSTTVYSSFGKAASFDEISTVLNRYKPRKRIAGSTISPATGLRTSPISKIMNNFALYCRVRIEYSAGQKTWVKEVRAKLWVFADHDTTPEYGRWEYYDEKEQCDEGCSG